MSRLRIAIVADWITSVGGAENVVRAFHEMFPHAPIFTALYDKKRHPWLNNADVKASFLQRIPGAIRNHQWFIGLMPYAFEQMNLDEFDVVLSSSHACAKGVITRPETLHISYCHTPMRYVWEGHHDYVEGYLRFRALSFFAKHWLHRLRHWDRLAADRVDRFIANSKCVSERISKYYRRQSEVVYPPVDVARFQPIAGKGDFFLAVGRLIPYKKFDLLVETFNKLRLPLKIVGLGREYDRLRHQAGSTIEFLGFVSQAELARLYAEARALVFPQYEDLGMVPIEAMAAGTPVIAYEKGGASETVLSGETGIFFQEQTVESLSQAISEFDRIKFNPDRIQRRAAEFSSEKFKIRMGELIQNYLNEFHS